MTEASYLRYVAVLRILFLGMGCLLSLFIAKVSSNDQAFWLQQKARVDDSYQREKAASMTLDKLLIPDRFISPEAKAIEAHIKAQDADNLNQLQIQRDTTNRDQMKTLLVFLLLQFGLLSVYLAFWYFMRNPQARLLVLMIKYGRKRGTFVS